MIEQIEKVTAAALHRGIRGEALELLGKHIDKNRARPLKLINAAAGTIGWGYRQQLKASFSQYLYALEALIVVAGFAAAPLTPGLVALAVIMIAITFRNSYTHNENAPPAFQYYLDSAGDAAAASLFLIVSQILARLISPSMALPAQLMYRGMLVCMPLLATVRMVFRQRLGSGASFRGPGWTAEQVYRRIWLLNALWMVLFYGVIAQTVTDRPDYFPDFLRGLLPIVNFGVWVCVQRVALRNRVRIEMLMTLIRKDEIFRKADNLPQGLEKGEPLYWPYVAFQALMFVLMGLALLGAVEPFLSVKPGVESAFRAFGALLGFVVSAGTWQYVKESNRAAGKALVLIARGL